MFYTALAKYMIILLAILELVKSDERDYCSSIDGYSYNPVNGNFMCRTRTASQCMQQCLDTGCNEWSYFNAMDPFNEQWKRHHICRCWQSLNTCFYGLMNLSMRQQLRQRRLRTA